MVMLNFNAATVDPNVALEALPSGQYPVMITKSEQKLTKDQQGSYLELEMTVQGGEYNGRKIFDRLNLQNKNAQTVEIAYRTLSAICYVTGMLQVQDSTQLHGKPFIVVINKERRNDRPNEELYSNVVKGYKDVNGNDPGKQGGVGSQNGAAPAWAGGNNQPQTGQPAPQQNGQQQNGQPAWTGAPQQNAAPAQTQAPAPQQNPAPAQNNGGFGGGAPAQNQGAAPAPQNGGGAPPWGNNAGGAPAQQGGGAPPWATGASA